MRNLIFFLVFAMILLVSTCEAAVRSRIERTAGGGSIPPAVFVAIAEVESNLDPTAIGDHGKAKGLFQVHAAATADVNRHYSKGIRHDRGEIFDVEKNATVAILYLYHLYHSFDGNLLCAISAYNKGASRITKNDIKKNCVDHAYVARVMEKFYENLYRANVGQ